MNWRRIHRWSALLSLVAVLSFYLAVRFVGNALLAPTNHPIGPPPDDLPVVTTTILSDSGSTLATWYISAANSNATVVLVHGIRTDRRSMLGRARLFHDAGFTVVMIDLQAHGESPGEHITVGYLEKYDVRAAVQFAREKDPSHRVAVVGQSLGGAATVLASPLDVDAIVLESVFPTIRDAVHNRIAARLGPLSYVIAPVLIYDVELRSGLSCSDVCPIEQIGKLGCPVLIAAGDADRHTTLAETARLFAAAAEPKQLVVFEGAAHTDLLAHDPDKYKREVLAFLTTHLARP